jgi:hypothetical protein
MSEGLVEALETGSELTQMLQLVEPELEVELQTS